MGGTVEGGRRARDKNLERDPDFYRKIGQKGGAAPHKGLKGFAANPALAKEAGRKGGSRKGNGKGRPRKVKDEQGDSQSSSGE